MSQPVGKSREIHPRQPYVAPALAKREKLARLAASASTGPVIVDGAG